jgi:serine/threonine-protein kinase HipA
MNAERVGRRTLRRGEHRFYYATEWLSSSRVRALSLSMPLRSANAPYRGEVVRRFFDNLLPDSDDIRTRMMTRFGKRSTEPFELLEEVGRDCVGAVQLLPPDSPTPDITRIRGRKASDADIERILTAIRSRTMGAQDDEDFRISLAGAQEKTAFLQNKGHWWIPEGATPTTHIFKLPMGAADDSGLGLDLSTSVENEWLCAQILRAFRIPCASCEVATFGSRKVLVVERFDRTKASRAMLRLPMEDFCQATGTPPGQKYERDGGPGIREILNILLGSSRPIEDREDFLRTQFLYWLLCAIDGHAKNFSIFLESGDTYRLTPRYDVFSAYPLLGKGASKLPPQKVKMAMAVFGKNSHYRWKEIRVAHWLETARQCGMAKNARSIFEEILERTPSVLREVEKTLPRRFPQSVAGPIVEGLTEAAAGAREQLTHLTS